MLIPECGVRVPVPDEKPAGLIRGHVRPAIPADCGYIAANMREEDISELKAAGQDDPMASMIECFERSERPLTGVWDGKPCAMFGIVRTRHRAYVDGFFLPRGIGAPWLLGTQGIIDARWQFLRESRKWLDAVSDGYDLLENHVHSRNTIHVRWLKWLGFEFGDDCVYPSGETFHKFYKVNNPCAS